MSQTDPRAVASRIMSCMQFRVEQSGDRIACTIVNLGEIEQAIVNALADAERRGLEQALEFAKWAEGRQPAMLDLMRKHNIVIDDFTDRMQKFAFELYTELCEVNFKARVFIEQAQADKEEGDI